MGFRPLEPRAGVALTVMSLALLLALRRSGAFRVGSTATLSKHSCRNGSRHGRSASASASAGSKRGRGAGPEGTYLPDIVHRTISAEELKVGPGHGRRISGDCGTKQQSCDAQLVRVLHLGRHIYSRHIIPMNRYRQITQVACRRKKRRSATACYLII